MLERFRARSGRMSARVDGVTLHSPYDPVKEAERFISAAVGPEPPSMVIILGEGLGYASSLVEERFPFARLIPVFYSEELFRLSGRPSTACWHPGGAESIAQFLRRVVGELDVEGLRVAEWPPSARLDPGLSRAANEAARAAVQEANGSLFTTAAAGRLWLRNSLRNFLSLEPALAANPCPPSAPVLLAAPGPSLEDALSAIRSHRTGFQLWALPGSLPALQSIGVEPDLVIMTDPSHWSMAHLHFARPACPVAMPLSAARGTWRLGTSVFLLCQPVFFETGLVERAGLHAPLVAPHGTVAATAIDLALGSTRAAVVAAGLDLCIKDILSHARPNAFDALLWMAANRLTPHYSASFHRALGPGSEVLTRSPAPVRVPRSLRTYAGWLGTIPAPAGRLYRLCPSAVALPSFRDLTLAGLSSLVRGPCVSDAKARAPKLPPLPERKRIVGALLDDWEGSTEVCLRALKQSGEASVLLGDPSLLSRVYYVSAGRLVEARRLARLGSPDDAAAAARGALEDCLAFLGMLRKKSDL